MADYGFSKLIELFEAVPGTVEVTEDADGERLLQLTDSERLQVVGDHITKLIRASRGDQLRMDDLAEVYRSCRTFPNIFFSSLRPSFSQEAVRIPTETRESGPQHPLRTPEYGRVTKFIFSACSSHGKMSFQRP